MKTRLNHLLLLALLATACIDNGTEPLTDVAALPVKPQAIVVPALPVALLESHAVAHAINGHGVVAGTSTIHGVWAAAIWRNGVRTNIGRLPGSGGSEALDINDKGEVVGASHFVGSPKGFIWRDDGRGLIELGHLGGGFSKPYAINNRSQVVGESKTANGETHAFLWENGVMRDLGLLGRTPQINQSFAFDINDAGVVVGVSTVLVGANTMTHAFKWENGVMTDITGIYPRSAAYAINNHGVIAGHVHNGTHEAAIWNGNVPIIQPSLGRGGTIYDINDDGVAVGESMLTSGTAYAVLWDDNGIRDLGYYARDYQAKAYAINRHEAVVGYSGTNGVYWGSLAPVNHAPVIALGGPYVGVTGASVAFAFSGSDPDGDVLTFTWDFGDGTTGRGPQLPQAHTYQTAGAYTVSIGASDPGGMAAFGTVAVTIAQGNRAPTLSIGGPYSGRANDQTAFTITASDADGDALSYSWSLGDGTNGSGAAAPAGNNYAAEGDFVLSVTATDVHGASVTGTTPVTIRGVNTRPIVNVGGPYEAVVGQLLSFNVSAHDPDGDAIVTYSFFSGETPFGVGMPTPPTNHTYAAPGTYVLTVVAYDRTHLSGSASTTVTVHPANRPPVVDVRYSLDFEGRPAPIRWSATDPDAKDVLTYEWDFGDGTTGSGAVLPTQHVYVQDGDYTLTLTAIDRSGHRVSDSDVMDIWNVDPQLTPIPDATLFLGESYVIRGSFTDPGVLDVHGGAVSWGDLGGFNNPLSGNESVPLNGNSYEISHTYATTGVFRVVMIVYDETGATIMSGGRVYATVTVISWADALRSISDNVRRINANGGITNAQMQQLTATLQSAIDSFDRGNTHSAANQINAFLNQLDANVRSNRMSSQLAATLAVDAQRVLRLAGS